MNQKNCHNYAKQAVEKNEKAEHKVAELTKHLWNGFASKGRKWRTPMAWQRVPGGWRGKCGRVLREEEHPDASFLGS